jgi:hypothetical protein
MLFTAGGQSCRVRKSPRHRLRISVRVATNRRRRSNACWVMANSARAISSARELNVCLALMCRSWKRGSRPDPPPPSSHLVADGLTRFASVPQCSDVLMPKSAVVDHASRSHGRPLATELPDVVEGQIAELCRDLAVEAKRMRQLQEQADELRRVIREWPPTPRRTRTPTAASRGGRR